LIRALPNLISLVRLFLVPLALLAIWNRQYERALVWCFIAGISDGVDGFLARRLHAQSRFGAYLDPLADKLLLSGVYLALGLDRAIPWWLVAVVFGRDALMLAFLAIVVLFTRHRDFPPSIWGKISTAIQIATALVILFRRSGLFFEIPAQFELFIMLLTVAATGWSAMHYLWRGVALVRPERRAAA
jgi:cardiolipin synthase